MLRRPVVSVFALAVVIASLAGCSSDDDGADEPKVTAPTTATTAGGEADATNPSAYVEAPTGTLADVDCWWPTDGIDPEVAITCSTLTVPENWNDPDLSQQVVLPVVRLHHQGVGAEVAPIVNLHGGPGGDYLSAAPVGASEDVIVRQADVVYYDQRGAGRALPSLNCPEKEEAVVRSLMEKGTVEAELARNRTAVRACHDRLIGEDIDLDMYNTIQSVNDLEALRAALGVETWNVRGASYGTRLGLAYTRVHPDRVRALAIDSVYAPDAPARERATEGVGAALDRLVAECAAADPGPAAFGDLGQQIEAAATFLDESTTPVTATVTVDGTEKEEAFHLDGGDFRAGMFAAMYQQDFIPLLPKIISDVADGDTSILPVYVETAVPLLTGLSEGAFYTVECADSGRLLGDLTAEDVLGDGTFAMHAYNQSYTWCADWPVAHVDAAFNEQVQPEVPTLVFGGTLDPVTPYADSLKQSKASATSRFVSVPRGGHGVARWDDCTTSALTGFLNDPTSELPACVASITPTPFSTGG